MWHIYLLNPNLEAISKASQNATPEDKAKIEEVGKKKA